MWRFDGRCDRSGLREVIMIFDMDFGGLLGFSKAL